MEHIETTPATSTHIETTATMPTNTPVKVWYVIVDNENTPLGKPLSLYDVINFDDVHDLLLAIKCGPYQAMLRDINIVDMEVWECPTLSLEGHGASDIEGLMKTLTLSEGSDGNHNIGGWEPVANLRLQKYQPLVIRVTL